VSCPADSELLTLDQAAEALGWQDTDRRRGGATRRATLLKAAVEAREAETKAAILHRRKGPKRTTIRITLHSLREHMPELFPGLQTREREQGTFRRTMRALNQRINERHDQLERRVARVEHRERVTHGMVCELAESVVRLAGAEPDPECSASRGEESSDLAETMQPKCRVTGPE